MQIRLYKLENLALFKEFLTSLLKVLELSKKSFHWIVTGNYTIKEAKKVFSLYFYNLLEENLNRSKYTKVL